DASQSNSCSYTDLKGVAFSVGIFPLASFDAAFAIYAPVVRTQKSPQLCAGSIPKFLISFRILPYAIFGSG
ncbi:MAG TPA: hypothetical protein VL689_16835, partial [Paraburkholderia sp.]|nr:hypothetical protein [Paraburkholderia sp.]